MYIYVNIYMYIYICKSKYRHIGGGRSAALAQLLRRGVDELRGRFNHIQMYQFVCVYS